MMASFKYQDQNAVSGLYRPVNFSNFFSWLPREKKSLNKKAFWQRVLVLAVKYRHHANDLLLVMLHEDEIF